MENISIPVQIYVDGKVNELRNEIEMKHNGAERHTDLRINNLTELMKEYNRVTGARLDAANEWRDQNKDIISKFTTKAELESALAKQTAIYNGRLRVMEVLLVGMILALVGSVIVI